MNDQALSLYQIPLILLGSFFFGESVIIPAAALASQGIWSPLNVLVYAYLGTLASDSSWFFLGKIIDKLGARWRTWYEHLAKKIPPKLARTLEQRPFLTYAFVKFLYGWRIAFIVFISLERTPFKRFLLHNAIGILPWLLVVGSIGWIAGESAARFILENTAYLAGGLLLLIVIFKLCTHFLTKLFARE
jgi:membrane protein DedA with SNARE-associated domain